jgi:NADH:ubiquinone oxidoreductase subunit 4 (subunit M)
MESDYQFLVNIGPTKPILNSNILLGLDGFSLPFVLLIGVIIPIVYLSN